MTNTPTTEEPIQIEFTDRYGGRAPSWLRGCFGQCEAMGCYPVSYEHALNDVYPSEPLTDDEIRAVHQIIERQGESEDGWYFIQCPKCHGTGRCSYLTTLTRIPRWIWRGIRTMINLRPSNGYYWEDHPSTYRQRLWLNFKIAFLKDLGVRI